MQSLWNRLMSVLHFRSSSNYRLGCFQSTEFMIHVPKCIGSMQHSQLLMGSRFEDFSQNCWLEGNLHRFGFISLHPDSTDSWELDTEECDTNSTVTLSSDTNICVSDSDSDINYSLFAANERILLPPPYKPEEPPPSYEDVLQEDEQMLRRGPPSIYEWMLW